MVLGEEDVAEIGDDSTATHIAEAVTAAVSVVASSEMGQNHCDGFSEIFLSSDSGVVAT